MSVNDKWHYCHNSEVLVGSRAMRDRHLRLLGYVILQVGHAHGAPLGPVRLVNSCVNQLVTWAPYEVQIQRFWLHTDGLAVSVCDVTFLFPLSCRTLSWRS